jgi:hypothetical protein
MVLLDSGRPIAIKALPMGLRIVFFYSFPAK